MPKGGGGSYAYDDYDDGYDDDYYDDDDYDDAPAPPPKVPRLAGKIALPRLAEKGHPVGE
eukprot:CAMPEP_0182903556 /NCGR_PEP_ID=MMETSP0034_2-20130328/31385_1 /TAXON_ID=156128 /ORGANISM="Nephroselmis pyriformis, Strain CCMP717" /LENGTH=59 /DNA_ID=CAMNT_0025038475 /DNA_START=53 /DNA_END=229 /DNA_ORIENTATION=+